MGLCPFPPHAECDRVISVVYHNKSVSDSCEICRDRLGDSPWGSRRTQRTPLSIPEEGPGRRYQLLFYQVVKRSFGLRRRRKERKREGRYRTYAKERKGEKNGKCGWFHRRDGSRAKGREGERCREERAKQKRTVAEGEREGLGEGDPNAHTHTHTRTS